MLSLQKNRDASVMLAHLPGMWTPFFTSNSVEIFADAYDQVLSRLGVKNVIVLGLSAGGLVGMAMRHPAIRQLVLADTPISTGDLWPLEQAFEGPAAREPQARKWFDDILGFKNGGWEDRGYRRLLDRLRTPTTVLLGDIPLQPRRTSDRMPSLVSTEDRAAYEGHPLVQTKLLPGVGHNISRDGTDGLVEVLTTTFAAVAAASKGG